MWDYTGTGVQGQRPGNKNVKLVLGFLARLSVKYFRISITSGRGGTAFFLRTNNLQKNGETMGVEPPPPPRNPRSGYATGTRWVKQRSAYNQICVSMSRAALQSHFSLVAIALISVAASGFFYSTRSGVL